MDGTLIDSEPLWLAAETAMLRRYAIELSDAQRDSLIGSGLRRAAGLFRGLGVPLTIEEIIDEWVAGVSAGLSELPVQWRPGARELLASLGSAGIPCALVTMSVRRLADQVAALLPAGTFQAIVAGDEVQEEKPHPEPYERGARALGVRIEDCLALEDSPTGLRSASSAGAVSIGIPNLLPLGGAPAHARWPSLAGLDARELERRFSALRGGDPASPAIATRPDPR